MYHSNCLAHEALRKSGRQALVTSEERYRDLFDEAPIAYVHEGVDTRFIRANRTAMRLLGITPEEVQGTYASSHDSSSPWGAGKGARTARSRQARRRWS